MSTYLVTGAAGFIAAKVCQLLLAAGHRVVGIDNLNDYYDVRLKDYRLGQLLGDDRWKMSASPRSTSYGGSQSFTSQRSSSSSARESATQLDFDQRDGIFVFEQVDIEDRAGLERIFSEFKFDAVFNLAGRAGVRFSLENPYVYMTTNAIGTLNLLECQRKFGVSKHVLASTSSLYAGSPMPFTEDLPVNTPLSPYAASKKSAEMLTYSYHKLYGLDITVARYFTVFGPAGRPDMSPFRFTKWIDEGKMLELFGDGTQSRDFTYVDDVARGTISAVRPLGYEVINLGGGRNPLSLQKVIGFIEAALGKSANIRTLPFHTADVMETWADITKARRLLDWQPLVSPEEGFQRTVDWHCANRKWLADILV